jgi:hypothetical protein
MRTEQEQRAERARHDLKRRHQAFGCAALSAAPARACRLVVFSAFPVRRWTGPGTLTRLGMIMGASAPRGARASGCRSGPGRCERYRPYGAYSLQPRRRVTSSHPAVSSRLVTAVPVRAMRWGEYRMRFWGGDKSGSLSSKRLMHNAFDQPQPSSRRTPGPVVREGVGWRRRCVAAPLGYRVSGVRRDDGGGGNGASVHRHTSSRGEWADRAPDQLTAQHC